MLEIQSGKQVCAGGTHEPESDERLQDSLIQFHESKNVLITHQCPHGPYHFLKASFPNTVLLGTKYHHGF